MKIKGIILALVLAFVGSAHVMAQMDKWQNIHTVKKKETIFGISRMYGITIDELIDANPDMRKPEYELQKGATLFIPFHKEKEVKPVEPVAKPEPKSVSVGVMLPLHNVDGDGKRMVEYYRGMLLAVNDLKQKGINVNVKAFNVNQEADVRKILTENDMTKLDFIFGPLYTVQVAEMGNFCRMSNVKMVIPFSISSNEVDYNPMVYQVYQTQETLTEHSIDYFMKRFSDAHPIFVDCNDSTSKKGIFTFGLRKQLEGKGIQYNITNITSSDAMFAKAFDATKNNVVILNSGASPKLTQVIRKLDALKAANPGLNISLYGYQEWLMYQKYNNNEMNFPKYDTYIPSTFYYDESMPSTRSFIAKYRRAYHSELQTGYLEHFALTGYDQAMFFLGGKVGETFIPLQTNYHFTQASAASGFRNNNYQLIHFTANGVESIRY